MTRCRSCGSNYSRLRRKCPKCGRSTVTKFEKKSYSGVRQQQGRVVTDDDWNETSSVRKKVQKIANVRCSSCGGLNDSKRSSCSNCGANL